MNARRTIGGLLMGWMLLAAIAQAADDEVVFSGPQAGEKLLPFQIRGVYDDQAGKDIDVIGQAGERPVVLVFFYERTRPAFGLANSLMKYVGKRKDIAGAIIFLTDDTTETEKWLDVVRKNMPTGITIGVSKDGQEGPGAYGLNRNVALTILVAKDQRVTANFALIQPSEQADLAKIVKSIIETAGGEMPQLAELVGNRYDASRPEMRREEQVAFDPRETLGPLIRKDATPEQVDAVAKKVESLAKENTQARQRIGEIARRIIESGKLENYGTPRAQEYLTRWSKEFADGKTTTPE